MAGYKCNWQVIAGIFGDGWTWLEMYGNMWMEINGNDQKWLEWLS